MRFLNNHDFTRMYQNNEKHNEIFDNIATPFYGLMWILRYKCIRLFKKKKKLIFLIYYDLDVISHFEIYLFLIYTIRNKNLFIYTYRLIY